MPATASATVTDLAAMVDEAAAALVPGPVTTSALATGQRTAGITLSAHLDYADGRVSGSAAFVLGADAAGVLLLPPGTRSCWSMAPTTASPSNR